CRYTPLHMLGKVKKLLLLISQILSLTPGTADRKPGAAFGTKGVTGLRIRCCHLLTLLPDLVTIIYVRGEVLGKNWPKIAGDFRKVNITFRLDVYCRYM